MFKRALFAVGIGILVTLLLVGAAIAADSAGLQSLARALFWQNTLMQSFVPLHNISTAEHPIYEGSPLNFFAFLASFPVGVAVYGSAAFVLIGRLARSR
jgi:hypothetical protein